MFYIEQKQHILGGGGGGLKPQKNFLGGGQLTQSTVCMHLHVCCTLYNCCTSLCNYCEKFLVERLNPEHFSKSVFFLPLQLQCVEGNILVASGENKVEVPFLKPDEQGELVVPFIAPAVPGHYERCVFCTCNQGNLYYFMTNHCPLSFIYICFIYNYWQPFHVPPTLPPQLLLSFLLHSLAL